MPTPESPHSSAPSDRVASLIAGFLGDQGFDDGPIDPEAASRFIADTDAAWKAYRDRTET
jgi:hypothetical protein